MQLAVPIAGVTFILVGVIVTVRRLVQSPPSSSTRRALWGTIGQLGATAIFLALATYHMHRGNPLFRWELVAMGLTAFIVVLTLITSKWRTKSST